jgi:hypothetical protein
MINSPPPVLDYGEPPQPDGAAKLWALLGGLLGVVWVLVGVFITILVAYSSGLEGFGIAMILGGEALTLAAVVAGVRPRRHTRPFVLGVVTGCAVGALIEGACFLGGF